MVVIHACKSACRNTDNHQIIIWEYLFRFWDIISSFMTDWSGLESPDRIYIFHCVACSMIYFHVTLTESRIAEMCHTNHVNNTIESTHAHIISPGYAGSFAQNNNKCHLTLLSIAEYQYTRFTLYSIEFHIQPLDPTLDECCEESVQYVKIRIFRADESVETLYFCGQAQVNLSFVATRVDVTFKREAIGLPGFHIIYTGKYDPL